jgi:thiol:disulfide interchange protein
VSPLPTALVAGTTLVVAFATAQVSGVRALGGVVLLAGAVWCVARSVRSAGWVRVGAVVVVGLVAFAGSHVLARVLPAWPSALLAAALLGVVTWVLVDRPRSVPTSVPTSADARG